MLSRNEAWDDVGTIDAGQTTSPKASATSYLRHEAETRLGMRLEPSMQVRPHLSRLATSYLRRETETVIQSSADYRLPYTTLRFGGRLIITTNQQDLSIHDDYITCM